jgi:hypothetical protein
MIRVTKVPAAVIRPKVQKMSCVECRYFFHGQCTAFASQEPVTGVVTFFDAIDMRLDETKCGIRANWFTPKKHV